MESLDGLKFNGTFRDYQQKVLDRANEHIKDGKINIVAAPGSGKTILGLELICRLKSPCLILSPTVTIRDQWGERFADFFIPNKNQINNYYSNNLNKLSLLNSITYQALYSAINKVETKEEDETVDYSNIDLFKIVKEQNITTICLDEAHHLQNEWQKALEKFLKGISPQTKIVSLTATPPYDANEEEWRRYQTVCGEIDEEIFVPELVKTNTLCPHQDFVYFNFPTNQEVKEFTTYKNKAYGAMYEFVKLPVVQRLYNLLNVEQKKDYDFLYTNAKEIIALMIVFEFGSLKNNKKMVKLLTNKSKLPEFSLKFAETAVNFLISNLVTTEEEKDHIKNLFKRFSLMEKGKIALDLNDKLKKKIYSSLGKLDSITEIAKSEMLSLGDSLRMLILTDYIKKESIADIGTNNSFSDISIVSIFETLRRNFTEKNIGVLSGSLCILPTSLSDYLINEQGLTTKVFSSKVLQGTNYSVFNFKGNNKQKVSIVGNLFSRGKINILVGTKSLLGEGWDSPCINSLILASFVGSFMLSNQMRGRAIRIDKNNPNKVSNIWHLATVEPDYIIEDSAIKKVLKKTEQSSMKLKSCDYEMLERRFNCFVGPNYQTAEIESGVDRITVIQPPYTKQGIDNINQKTMLLSQNREKTKTAWSGEFFKANSSVAVQTQVPKEKKIPAFTFKNVLLELIILSAMGGVVNLLIDCILNSEYLGLVFLLSVVLMVLFVFFLQIFNKLIAHFTPTNSIKNLTKAVLKTLQEMEEISTRCGVKVKNEDVQNLSVYLTAASTREQNIFNTAITELLSPIENPRYILIRLNGIKEYDYKCSLACPSIIGQKKETAEVFQEYLKKHSLKLKLVYTRSEQGRKLILDCRKKSYISINQKYISKKYKVTNWE